MSKTNLDKLDLEIIKILLKDSRTPISEIAKKLDLSRPTVRKRLNKLLRLGVIKRFTIILRDDIGTGIRVIYEFKVDNIEDLLKLIKNRDDFISIYITSGENKVIAEANHRDMNEFKKMMDVLLNKNIYFIANIVLNKIKDKTDYIPELLFKFKCDYCGKEINYYLYKYTLHNITYYFCCKACLNNFKRFRETI